MLESKCDEFLQVMRGILRCNFVKNAVKSFELFFSTAFDAITAFLTKIHCISYKNFSKNLNPSQNYNFEQIFETKILKQKFYHQSEVITLYLRSRYVFPDGNFQPQWAFSPAAGE